MFLKCYWIMFGSHLPCLQYTFVGQPCVLFVTAISCAEHFSLKHIEPVCFLPEILVYVPGIPTLAYGLASWMLVRFHEDIDTSKGQVRIYFLNKEEKNARY